MKNILIPTDFSENSHIAIRFALEYFSDIPINFYILHVSYFSQAVLMKLSGSFIGGNDRLQAKPDPISAIEREVEYCQSYTDNPYHNFFMLYEEMLLVEAIRKQIVENEIDAIVMGTKGDSRSRTDEMGSHTYEVITKVKCPIMVIPENARYSGIRNIAFVTDYNAIYRNRVLATLSETLHLHRSPLRVLNIRTKNTNLTPAQIDNKGFLHYFFKDIRHSFHYMENINLEPGIQDFVETWEISMVTIAAKNLNFIQRLMLRPVSKTITYHTDVPFLVLHE